jgi:hypothetical protein
MLKFHVSNYFVATHYRRGQKKIESKDQKSGPAGWV